MPGECAAPGCQEKVGNESTLSFHQFPKDKALKKEWVVRINRLDPKTKKLWEPRVWDVLCSKHFVDECFTSRTRMSKQLGLAVKAQLLPDAIPTVFQNNEISRKRKNDLSDRRVSLAKRLRHTQTINMILTSENNGEPSAVKVSQWDEKNSSSEDCCFQPEAPGPSDDDSRNTVEVPTKSKDIGVQVQLTMTMTSQSQQTVQLCLHKEVQTDPDPISDPERCDPDIDTDRESENENDTSEWNEPAVKEHWNTLTNQLDINPFLERKFIVYEKKLEELLSVCRQCSNPSTIISKEECGTGVKIRTTCQNSSCGHHYSWTSQPYSFKLPLGNLVLAAAAFFTACSPTRLITAFKHANIACFTIQTFFSIQTSYLLPAIRNVWHRSQERLFAARRGRSIKVAGDGRCDSPGHCAKYGSYTLMDAETSEVLHIELIQSNQVKSSHAMELDGLKKGLQKLKDKVTISHLITDRHASVKKYMRQHHSQPNEQKIVHHFDIWHMAKGVVKKLDAASRSRSNAILSLWSKSISNHMYWCSASSPEGSEREKMVRDKWISICNHIVDIHQGHGGSYTRCQHDQLKDRAWIKKGSQQHKILENIIKNQYLLHDIGMLSPDCQTASLESYHAVVCHFAPKLTSFSYSVMEAKLYLAAMHFNANAGRQQAATEDGDLRWTIVRPKACKGAPVAKILKEKPTRDYLLELNEELLEIRNKLPSYEKAKSAQTSYNETLPAPLSKTSDPVDKAVLVAQHRQRLNWRPPLSTVSETQ